KSQTITNLLTRAVADGRRVLFVAEKRAALDVVARRLEAVGMGTFALDLHDRGSRPSAVRAQVRAALDHSVDVDAAALAADGEDLRSARRGLNSYAERLHSLNAVGLSFYSARTAVLSAGEDVAALPVPPAFVAGASAETVTAVRRALALLPDIAELARPSAGHAWAFIDTVEVDITAVQQAAVEVDRAIRALPAEGPLAALLRAVRTPEQLDTLVHVLAGPTMPLEVLDEVRSQRWAAAADAVTGEVAALVGAAHPGLDVALPEALALPLGQLFLKAQTAAATGRLSRHGKLGAVRAQLASALQPGVRVRRADVPELTAALFRVQNAVQALATRAAAVPGLRVPATWNPFLDTGRFLLDAEVVWLRRSAAAVGGTGAFAVALRKYLAGAPDVDPAAVGSVARSRDALRLLLATCATGSAQLESWSGTDGLVLRWAMTRPERGVEYTHPMSLRRWVSLLDTLEPLRAAGLTEARAALLTGSVRAEDALRALDRGLAEASVVERREATGLGQFDAELHERMISRFATASSAVREHLVTALPAGVLAARSVDPASADGQVGALRAELDRTRGGLGVRGLLTTHGDLITTLMPCVLVSPDSVARFVPAVSGLFDLVVFDEASQIRVADAVGALGRARAAVVVGDSKQMPPTSVAEPAASGDGADGADGELVEDAGAVQDEESILSECVRAQVPRHWLSWHYRSQDESLIAFSNAEYYERRLSSFPAPVAGAASSGADGRGVSLVQVGGTFHRSGSGRLLRTNPVEAAAVVAEVLRRFDAATDLLPSIGVVTFNAQQRTHIEELLRDAGNERVVEALDRTDGEGLFVKNLENVQGDERDVVFFSTGFSPDARGQLPLNFGPLNRTGGERRLNVAVTRARRQVVVFCSFAPEQLRAEDTASVGVKHLRAYLDLAAMGTDGLTRAPHQAPAPDRHREEIAAALRFRGLVVRTDVGLSEFRVDLAVARASAPDVPVLAVLLDGAAWAGRRTAGDRDGLPVDVLRGMLGWPAVERVWLPSWLGDPDAVLDRLVTAVEATPLTAKAPEVRARVHRPTPYRRTSEGSPLPRTSPQLAVVPAAPAAPVPAGAPGSSGRHA
ncbi:MAG: putative helicase, partial [Modestobacter sp.]|nr:putative helicase [Modestobacter sp.]